MKHLLTLAIFCALFGCKEVEPTLSSQLAGTYSLTTLQYNFVNYPLGQGGTLTLIESGDKIVTVSSLTVGTVSYSQLNGQQLPLEKISNGTILINAEFGKYKDRILELNFKRVKGDGTLIDAWYIKASKN